jgi:hypothetical protein
MNRLVRLAAPSAVLAAAAVASASGVSDQIGPLETSVGAALDAAELDALQTKAASRVRTLLARKSNARSLAKELGSVKSAVKFAESKLTGLLDDPFRQAADGYAGDLAITREQLALAVESPTASKRLRKRWTSALARFDRALPAGTPPEILSERYRQLAAAAAAGKGFTPYDPGATYDWVLQTIELAPIGVGLDLDDDGTADNAVGGLRGPAALLGIDLDAMFADILQQEGSFALLEMWSVQKISGDPFVLAGLLTATDGDADPLNDFSGTGLFAVTADQVDASGHPAARVVTGTAKRGAYAIDFTGQTVNLPGFALPAGSKILVEGTATASSNTGTIGVAIPMDLLFASIEAGGTTLNDLVKAQLRALADLDTDPETQGKESMSAAFSFTGVAALKSVQP